MEGSGSQTESLSGASEARVVTFAAAGVVGNVGTAKVGASPAVTAKPYLRRHDPSGGHATFASSHASIRTEFLGSDAANTNPSLLSWVRSEPRHSSSTHASGIASNRSSDLRVSNEGNGADEKSETARGNASAQTVSGQVHARVGKKSIDALHTSKVRPATCAGAEARSGREDEEQTIDGELARPQFPSSPSFEGAAEGEETVDDKYDHQISQLSKFQSMRRYYRTDSSVMSRISLTASHKPKHLVAWEHDHTMHPTTLSFRDAILEREYTVRYFHQSKKPALVLAGCFHSVLFICVFLIYIMSLYPLPSSPSSSESGLYYAHLWQAFNSSSVAALALLEGGIAVNAVVLLAISPRAFFERYFHLCLAAATWVAWSLSHCYLYFIVVEMVTAMERVITSPLDCGSVLPIFLPNFSTSPLSASVCESQLAANVYVHEVHGMLFRMQMLCCFLSIATLVYMTGPARLRSVVAFVLGCIVLVQLNLFFVVTEELFLSSEKAVKVDGDATEGTRFPSSYRYLFVFDFLYVLSFFLLSVSLRTTEKSIRSDFIRFKFEKWRMTKEGEARALEAYKESMKRTKWLLSVAHEIRTPVHNIFGSAELLSLHGYDEERDNLVRHSEVIRQSADSLLGIVESVLDLAKIDVQDVKLQVETIDVLARLNDIVMQVGEEGGKRGVKVQHSIDPTFPAHLRVDFRLLSKLLRTLLDSSVRHTDKGVVGLKCEVEARDKREVKLKFAVRDEGEPILEEELPHIFHRFHAADKGSLSRQRTRMGNRLGLTLCAELCRLLGGGIHASSDEESTTFTFTVVGEVVGDVDISSKLNNIAQSGGNDADTPAPLHTATASRGPGIVVVVSPNEHLRHLLRPWISHLHCLYVGSSDIDEAMAVAAGQKAGGEKKAKMSFALDNNLGESVANMIQMHSASSVDNGEDDEEKTSTIGREAGVSSKSNPLLQQLRAGSQSMMVGRRGLKARVSAYTGEDKLEKRSTKRMAAHLQLCAVLIDDACSVNLRELSNYMRENSKMKSARLCVLSSSRDRRAMAGAMAPMMVDVIAYPILPDAFASVFFTPPNHDDAPAFSIRIDKTGVREMPRALSAVTEVSTDVDKDITEEGVGEEDKGTAKEGKALFSRISSSYSNLSSSDLKNSQREKKRGAAMAEKQEIVHSPAGGVEASSFDSSDQHWRVLVVDDEKLTQKVTSRMLRALGYTCVTADDGEHALAVLEKAIEDEDQIDLILMDYQMPRMNGVEATMAIRSRRWRFNTIPIVAATANGDRDECMQAGMDGYMTKPFRKESVGAVLADMLSQCDCSGAK